jgi:hypothetical protein
MKKSSLFLLLVTCYLLLVGVAYASTPSASDNQIKDQLIENIASRVAELKLVEKRGIVGVVSEVSNIHIAITDVQNNTRFIDVDELTKFSSPSAKGSFGISDITKGTTVGLLGLYNKESRRLLARFVNVITLPKYIYATVDSIDSRNLTLNTSADDKKSLIVDIQTSTKISLYTKDSGITRSGFTKIKVNDEIVVIGYGLAGDKNMIAASRIIILNETIPPSPTQSVSTTSGKKITPL